MQIFQVGLLKKEVKVCYELGSVINLFRTRMIETELRSLVNYIKLIFKKFDIELTIFKLTNKYPGRTRHVDTSL